MNIRVKEALIALGVVAGIVYMTMPKSSSANGKINKIAKPEVADDTEMSEKENARIALDAFITAVENKESMRRLQQLNQELAQTFGLRVYKQGAYYVAKDSTGREILYAK
jgi:hypothetical protein